MTKSTTRLNPPKKTLGGEEISNGDVTIPPTYEIQKSKPRALQKINPSIPHE